MTELKRWLREGAAAALVAVGLLAACSPCAIAQSRDARPAGVEPGAMYRRINLGVGRSVIIDLPRDASEIFVADPKVANAVIRSARKIYLIAAGGGQTSI